MSAMFKSGWIALPLAFVSCAAFAQPAAGASAHTAIGTQAGRPLISGYQSAFDGYRAYADEPVKDWSEVNQRVRDVGGWRTYAAEIQADSDAEAKTKAAGSDQHAPTSGASGHHKP